MAELSESPSWPLRSGEGYDIHRRLGFQDYCHVSI